MVNACILVRVVPAKGREVSSAIRGLEGVRKAFSSFGRFDVVAFAEAADRNAAIEIAKKVNSLEGVRRTETLMEA